jgi:5-formyltetrahydrofolate cyclo-ligase
VSDPALTAVKRTLRVRMRAARTAIAADPTERTRRSATICAAVVVRIEAHAAEHGLDGRRMHVLLYDPLPGEPDLAALIGWCATHDVAVYVPSVDGDALRVVPGDVDPALLDVAVVPGLAFTADGRRLGQGGGHFDRFLPRLREDCLRVGVAFREQLVAELPTAEHDAGVDVVITG